jgi:hypothetical protein
MFRPILRPIIKKTLHHQKLMKTHKHHEVECKIPCDKIYHSEKFKKMDEKLQDIENKIVNNNFNHLEEYKTINEKLREINIDASWASFNTTLCLVIITFWKN